MIIKHFDNEADWQQARLGKITGSKVKDILNLRGGAKKIGFYQLIADRLAIPADGENPMDRGHRLEEEAVQLLEKELNKKFDTSLVMWSRDDNESMAISPDAYLGETEAVEVKCLGSARHIEAILKNDVPADYKYQVIQYFIVNDKLKTLYFAMYDPRLLTKEFFYFTIKRAQVKKDVEKVIKMEREMLDEVEEVVSSLMEI